MIKSAIVIEDSHEVNALWRRLIRKQMRYGRIHGAATIGDADALLNHGRYDTIVCDLHMGDDSGVGVVLKNRHTTLTSRIFIITAADQWEIDSAKCILMDEGFSDIKCYQKPLRGDQLTDFMESL